jgi:DNA-binding transcriptional LysR family regulator
MRREDLTDLAAFMAVADTLNFRAAASRLGVTPSAFSHTIRQLEERLGVRLLHRTTRSVSLTDAGLRLFKRLRPAVDEISGALEDLNEERQRPFGHLRICAPLTVALAVIPPIWGRYLSTYPEVELELCVDDGPLDIVAKGCDAGISSHANVAADMIAVRVMGPMQMAVVGAPAYFAARAPPRTPDDLARHNCVQFRMPQDGSVFEWPFEQDGKSQQVRALGRLMVNDPVLAIRAAVDGLGIAITIEPLVAAFLHSGQLVRVLEDWSPAFEGFYLYYPSHRHVPAALRALIDTIRGAPRSPSAESALAYPFAAL